MTLGAANAPVTLVEYIDLQCPICREFETTVMPDLIAKYVKTGKVKVEARVLKFIGPDSERGRNAMLAAAEQNKAFDFSQVLYANQGTENTGWLTDDMIGQIAASVPGMRVHDLLSARNSSSREAAGREVRPAGHGRQGAGHADDLRRAERPEGHRRQPEERDRRAGRRRRDHAGPSSSRLSPA